MSATKRVLLTSVFGPFGVDDAFGRKENVMELFHNQVTKAQGVASLRFHHRSIGLYFIAENLQTPVTVLDFPSRARFERELRRERYDAIGISFIAPNFVKAREMARMIRAIQPHAEIILGGHGASIENVAELIDCDHVVRGEGVGWFRQYLGEDQSAPFVHPVIPAAEEKRLFGVPVDSKTGLLIPGVGCVNGCRFCATSHFFDRRYTSFFSSGEALYREAIRVADALGKDELFVMDENFLKDTERAHELLALMKRDGRPLTFLVFSSAEAIQAFGVENLARLGVTFLWIGAESKRETYAKNAGTDLPALIRSLRDHGIFVLVSGILFSEHHTRENIDEDIDFLIGLEGVYTQFMMLTPLPTTALYNEYKAQGRIDFSIPYEEWHGQKMLNYDHPAFERGETERVLNGAFQREYETLSSSAYRMFETAVRGYETLTRLGKDDPWLARRAEQQAAVAAELRILVPTLLRFAVNDAERARVRALEERCHALFGAPGVVLRAKQMAALAIATVEWAKVKTVGNLRQPKTRLVRYRWTERDRVAPPGVAPHGPATASHEAVRRLPVQQAACSTLAEPSPAT